MSVDIPVGIPPGGSRPLVVQAVFHVADDQQAQTVAARMIESAQQLANLPECECDVDVSVSRSELAAGSPDTAGVPAGGRPSNR